MKVFIPIVLTIISLATQGYAISCQNQGGSCYDGGRDCPAGKRSVFWDTGCKSGFWPWQKDDKCCV
ncbi:hypothetical protein PHISCL_07228 [Aspergillus sclerotialis]|uniref:Uncharacterized protein n=1 Tax=Aspergillus sclerotialis TaxID=2070753 RepID=A0A3A2ZBF5_9EURO|nr:hypothetical protein PHISCL_07228 [Aspergillus sclerotialis]